jgi:hypothetical protein
MSDQAEDDDDEESREKDLYDDGMLINFTPVGGLSLSWPLHSGRLF